MKAIDKFLFSALILFLLPLVVSAHPGHEHAGSFWQIFTHFVFTYYIYFIAGLAIITGVFGYIRQRMSRQKHSLIQREENKK